jgi:hypothetical protein
MNHDTDHPTPFLTNAACAREWQAQEEALRRERLGLDPAADDARVRRYRPLSRALREPLDHSLPPDFAQRVTARIAVRSARAIDTRFEQVLTLGLGLALLLAAVFVTVLHGDSWLHIIVASVPIPARPVDRWLLAFGACLGATFLLGLRHRQTPA